MNHAVALWYHDGVYRMVSSTVREFTLLIKGNEKFDSFLLSF